MFHLIFLLELPVRKFSVSRLMVTRLWTWLERIKRLSWTVFYMFAALDTAQSLFQVCMMIATQLTWTKKLCCGKKRGNVCHLQIKRQKHSMKIRGAGKLLNITRKVSGEMSRVWLSLLAHADKKAIKQLKGNQTFISHNKVGLQPTESWPRWFETLMPSTAVKLRTILETVHSAVHYTIVA